MDKRQGLFHRAFWRALVGAGLCLLMLLADPAHALKNQCHFGWTDESIAGLHLRADPENQWTFTKIDQSVGFMVDDVRRGDPIHPEDHQMAVTEASRLLQLQGVSIQMTTVDGYSAIEILPGSGTGWNRMARQLQKLYETRLLFSPIVLAENLAFSFLQMRPPGEAHELYISVKSLRDGRAQKKLLHDVTHVYHERLAKTKPTCLNATCFVADPQSALVVSSSSSFYRKGQRQHEMATTLKEIIHLIRDIRIEDTQENRAELAITVKEGLDIARNSELQIKLLGQLREKVDANGIRSASDVYEPDPLYPPIAVLDIPGLSSTMFIATSDKTIKVAMYGDFNVTVDLLYAPATRNFADAPGLIKGLHENSQNAKLAARLWLRSALAQWEKDFLVARSVFSGVMAALEPVTATASVETLMAITNVDAKLLPSEKEKTDTRSSVRSR